MQLPSNVDRTGTNRMDKYKREFERLLKRYARIVSLLGILDADIAVRREIERDNDITFTMRPSIQVEQTREKWQKELRQTKADIYGMLDIMIKQAKNE